MTVSNKNLQQLHSFDSLGAKLIILVLLCVASLSLPSLVYHSNAIERTTPVSGEYFDPVLQTVTSKALRTAIDRTNAERGGAVVIDANSGAIKTLVSLDGWGSNEYARNIIVDAPWEPGSVVKPLTMATALNEHAISLKTSFYDSGETYVDGFRVTNALSNTPRKISPQDIITHSINTGTVNVLRSLGGGTINLKARQTLYDYFMLRYHFGSGTAPGVPTGSLPSPMVGDKLELTYANMAFGQDMTITPLQLVCAYAAMLNSGTYYTPLLNGGTPHALGTAILSQQTSAQIRQLLQNALAVNNPSAERAGYILGGKSGTAHVATPSGDYYNSHRDNGTYIGFVSSGKHLYIMLVRLDQPKTSSHTFASNLAREAWTNIITTKIDTTGSFTH